MIVMWVEPMKRDAIIERLKEAGVETSIHYDPIPLEPYFRERFGYRGGEFPVAERLGHSTITLPMHPLLTAKEQAYVIASIEQVCHHNGTRVAVRRPRTRRRASEKVG
jgi:dTDP-4-amino-4,6-dideoxygalactose transaminase